MLGDVFIFNISGAFGGGPVVYTRCKGVDQVIQSINVLIF